MQPDLALEFEPNFGVKGDLRREGKEWGSLFPSQVLQVVSWFPAQCNYSSVPQGQLGLPQTQNASRQVAAFLDELGATSSSEDDEDASAQASLPSNALQMQVQ